MPNATDQRRRTRFLRALAATGQSQNGWAREAGISRAHLSLVLTGKRESAALTERIDAFIREHLTKRRVSAA